MECWKSVGGASWQWADEPALRFLSPREVLERRAACRDVVAAVVAKQPAFADTLQAVDPIVVRGDEPITIYDVTKSGNDDRHVTHFDRAQPRHAWWEKSLGWIFATQLLSELVEKLVLAVPELSLLRPGRAKSQHL